MCVCVCVRARACVCVRACMRACVRGFCAGYSITVLSQSAIDGVVEESLHFKSESVCMSCNI